MRHDLLQLGNEALILLSNRGLVKRAAKMLERGQGPEITESDDGLLTATFADGPVVHWPPETSLEEAGCSCGSSSVCRHRVCTVLAYQAIGDGVEATHPEVWSPGEFDDERLKGLVGQQAVSTARRRMRDGLDVEVHRGAQPRAHLPNGTVRFPVPHSLEMVHCDAVGAEREVMVVLAVWAYRKADASDSDGPVLQVHLIDEYAVFDPTPFEALDAWTRVALETGIANLPAPAAARLHRAKTQVARHGWVWVEDALADLKAQIEAFKTRDARYGPSIAASLIGELMARRRAARSVGPPSPGWFVGTGVAPETRLEHLRLTGLGARVRSIGGQVDIDVYLLDQRAGAVLVLSRTYGREPDLDLGSRAVGGGRLALAALAGGQLSTQGAVRMANRQVRLTGERGLRTHDLKPGDGAWQEIDSPVRIPDAESLESELAHRPPRILRPRLRAEDLRVLTLGEVKQVMWLPGSGELVAEAESSSGDPIRIRLAHDPSAPGACGVLEHALLEGPSHLAGHVRMHGRVIEVQPTALAVNGAVVVPALAGSRSVTSHTASENSEDRIGEALQRAATALADIAHHGLESTADQDAVQRASEQLDEVGLRVAAQRLRGLLNSEDRVSAWADAWLTVEVAQGRPRA